MRTTNTVLRIGLPLLLLAFNWFTLTAQRSSVSESYFVFKGTVIALHTSVTNEASLENTGVMKVDEVIVAPENLKPIKDVQITVVFR